jgi:RND superfamily putative drug exporter
VLLPSVLALLGERTWYLPRWLRWLPKPPAEDRPAPDTAQRAAPEPVGAGPAASR